MATKFPDGSNLVVMRPVTAMTPARGSVEVTAEGGYGSFA